MPFEISSNFFKDQNEIVYEQSFFFLLWSIYTSNSTSIQFQQYFSLSTISFLQDSIYSNKMQLLKYLKQVFVFPTF